MIEEIQEPLKRNVIVSIVVSIAVITVLYLLTNFAYMAGAVVSIKMGTVRSKQGRDSPIIKHYSLIKNPCFVTCVNSTLCS
jgi:hypothetical protein